MVLELYGTYEHALDDLESMLCDDVTYHGLFPDEKEAFQEWVMEDPTDFASSEGIDWGEALSEWKEIG